MTSEPLVLGFDTSAAHCAAALVSGETVLASRVDEMARGQAEHLMPLLEALLADQDFGWSDLTRIGVGIGPGNFTGIRISVSAARGLALALGIPAVGVSTFDASLFGQTAPAVALVPAPRDQLYVLDRTKSSTGFLTSAPYESSLPSVYPPEAHQLASHIALHAATGAAAQSNRPAPLYIRAADAAPSRDVPPTIL